MEKESGVEETARGGSGRVTYVRAYTAMETARRGSRKL